MDFLEAAGKGRIGNLPDTKKCIHYLKPLAPLPTVGAQQNFLETKALSETHITLQQGDRLQGLVTIQVYYMASSKQAPLFNGTEGIENILERRTIRKPLDLLFKHLNCVDRYIPQQWRKRAAFIFHIMLDLYEM